MHTEQPKLIEKLPSNSFIVEDQPTSTIAPSSSKSTSESSSSSLNYEESTEIVYSISSEGEYIENLEKLFNGPSSEILDDSSSILHVALALLFMKAFSRKTQSSVLEKFSAHRNGGKGFMVMLSAIAAYLPSTQQSTLVSSSEMVGASFLSLLLTLLIQHTEYQFKIKKEINEKLTTLIENGGQIPQRQMNNRELLDWLKAQEKKKETATPLISMISEQEIAETKLKTEEKQTQHPQEQKEQTDQEALRNICVEDIQSFTASEISLWIFMLTIRDLLVGGNYLGGVIHKDITLSHTTQIFNCRKIFDPRELILYSVLGLLFAGLAATSVKAQTLWLTKSELECKLALNAQKQKKLHQETSPSCIDSPSSTSSLAPEIKQQLILEEKQLKEQHLACRNQLRTYQSQKARKLLECTQIGIRGFQSGAMMASNITGVPASAILLLKLIGITLFASALGPLGWISLAATIIVGIGFGIYRAYHHYQKIKEAEMICKRLNPPQEASETTTRLTTTLSLTR